MEFNSNIDDHSHLDMIHSTGIWDLQAEDYCLPPRGPQLGASECLWDQSGQNEDSLLYMLGCQTPTRDCGDFGFDNLELGDKTNKGLDESRELSQSKRRRMLQFDSDSDNVAAGNQLPSVTINSNVVNPMSINWNENLLLNSQWSSDFLDDSYLFSNEVLDQTAEGWMESCFDEFETDCNTKDMSSLRKDIINIDDHPDGQELLNVAPDVLKVVPEIPKPTKFPKAMTHVKDLSNIAPPMRNLVKNPSTFKIFKGRKYIDDPSKLTTSIAYPFDHIKPCELQGSLTLKDINQRIHAPPRSKDSDSSLSYPTSAFSGKPVVVRTKIRTDGGKGSITILRTKG